MSQKKYTTREQRLILESVEVDHVKGRQYDEAQEIIRRFVERGALPEAALSPASDRQLEVLERIGIVPQSMISKEAASELITQHQSIPDELTTVTEKQADYIEALGGILPGNMTRRAATQFIEYLLERVYSCPKCSAYANRRSRRCPSCGGFLPSLSPISCPASIYRRPKPDTATSGSDTLAENKTSRWQSFLAGLLDFLGFVPRHRRSDEGG